MDPKRLFDLTFSVLGLLILSPLLLIISLCIMLDSGRPIIYQQKRLGKNWKYFLLYKFRTMNFQLMNENLSCSTLDDKRITKVGKYLRKYKMDEIPQLFNVLKGDMSFVGPRPELFKFVEYYSDVYNEILNIKQWINDLASIKFRNEYLFLRNNMNNIEEVYLNEILPQKLKYNLEYLKKQSFLYDLKLIFITIFTVIFR